MAKKYKRMSVREKKENAETRKRLRDEGILPPIKPKLNRRKFAEEVLSEWEDDGDPFYLLRAVHIMTPPFEFKSRITPEQVGVLKAMKLAIEYKRYHEELKGKGRSDYEIGELYERVIKPILDL